MQNGRETQGGFLTHTVRKKKDTFNPVCWQKENTLFQYSDTEVRRPVAFARCLSRYNQSSKTVVNARMKRHSIEPIL